MKKGERRSDFQAGVFSSSSAAADVSPELQGWFWFCLKLKTCFFFGLNLEAPLAFSNGRKWGRESAKSWRQATENKPPFSLFPLTPFAPAAGGGDSPSLSGGAFFFALTHYSKRFARDWPRGSDGETQPINTESFLGILIFRFFFALSITDNLYPHQESLLPQWGGAALIYAALRPGMFWKLFWENFDPPGVRLRLISVPRNSIFLFPHNIPSS